MYDLNVCCHCSPDQDELFDLILAGEFEYLSPFWDDISDSAKVRIIVLQKTSRLVLR